MEEDIGCWDDAEIVRRLQAGDDQAASQIIVKYERSLWFYLTRHREWRIHPDDADEALNQAFYKAVIGIGQGKYDGTKPLGKWLKTVARNAYVDMMRARGIEAKEYEVCYVEELGLDELGLGKYPAALLAKDPSADEQDDPPTTRAVRDALARMPESGSKLLEAVMFADDSREDLATALGVNRGRLRTRILRAKKALANLLKDDPLFRDFQD